MFASDEFLLLCSLGSTGLALGIWHKSRWIAHRTASSARALRALWHSLVIASPWPAIVPRTLTPIDWAAGGLLSVGAVSSLYLYAKHWHQLELYGGRVLHRTKVFFERLSSSYRCFCFGGSGRAPLPSSTSSWWPSKQVLYVMTHAALMSIALTYVFAQRYGLRFTHLQWIQQAIYRKLLSAVGIVHRITSL